MRQKFINSLGIILFPIVIILLSTDIVVTNEYVYKKLFQEYDVYATINASEETIDAQATSILKYLKDEEPLQSMLLNEKENAHMADVKKLFMRGYQLLVISSLLLVSCLLISKERRKMMIYGAIGTLMLLVAITAVDFSTLFYKFHLLFFNNDLWLLDPATDSLIKIYPQEIFHALTIRIGSLVLMAGIIGVSISLYKPRKASQIIDKSGR